MRQGWPGSGIPLEGTSNGIPRISAETLHGLLEGRYDDEFKNLYVVDCRYAYEFGYGHIRGAVHAGNPEEVRDLFFPDVEEDAAIVFHCELSCDRGPKLAMVLREVDRRLNKNRYPELFYPSVFILCGGYREYYEKFKEDCEGGYCPMRGVVQVENGEVGRATTELRAAMRDYERRWKPNPLAELAEQATQGEEWVGKARDHGALVQTQSFLQKPVGVSEVRGASGGRSWVACGDGDGDGEESGGEQEEDSLGVGWQESRRWSSYAQDDCFLRPLRLPSFGEASPRVSFCAE